MASSSFSKSSGLKFRKQKCGCGKPAYVKISKSVKNKNRLYNSYDEKMCCYFEWCNLSLENEETKGEFAMKNKRVIGLDGYGSVKDEDCVLPGIK